MGILQEGLCWGLRRRRAIVLTAALPALVAPSRVGAQELQGLEGETLSYSLARLFVPQEYSLSAIRQIGIVPETESTAHKYEVRFVKGGNNYDDYSVWTTNRYKGGTWTDSELFTSFSNHPEAKKAMLEWCKTIDEPDPWICFFRPAVGYRVPLDLLTEVLTKTLNLPGEPRLEEGETVTQVYKGQPYELDAVSLYGELEHGRRYRVQGDVGMGARVWVTP